MCDVYLGGLSDAAWRNELKAEISEDISIFDPLVANYDNYNETQKENQIERELFYIDKSEVIVFYFNDQLSCSSTLLELADAVAKRKYVIVCLDGEVKDMNKIKRYCKYRGVLLVYSIEELITNTEEYIAQIDLCKNHNYI